MRVPFCSASSEHFVSGNWENWEEGSEGGVSIVLNFFFRIAGGSFFRNSADDYEVLYIEFDRSISEERQHDVYISR